MDVIDEALESSHGYLRHFISTLKVSTQPIEISCSNAAEILPWVDLISLKEDITA